MIIITEFFLMTLYQFKSIVYGLQYDLLQYYRPDVMCSTGSLVASVVGTTEEVLPFLEVVGSTVTELGTAIGTLHISGKHIGLSCFRRSSLVLTEFLYSCEVFFRNDGRMGILKYHPVLLIFVYRLL